MPKKEIDVREKTNKTKTNTDFTDFVTELRASIGRDDDSRAVWKNKMIAAVNQRLGVKRISNNPYPGAPDIPLPETDKLIKKAVPNLVMSAWAPRKMVLVRVQEGIETNRIFIERAKKTEAALNMLLRTKMDFFKKLMLAADFAKQHGHAIFRIVEEFKSRLIHKVIDLDELPEGTEEQIKAMSKEEKKAFIVQRFNFDLEDDDDKETVDDILSQFADGNRVIEFTMEKVTSLPNIEVPVPTKIITASYTTGINESSRVTYEFFLNRQQMEERIDSEMYRDIDLDELDLSGKSKGDDDIIESQKARNEGVEDESTNKELFRIHEVVTWYKPKKSKPARRWVFTFLADTVDAIDGLLRDIEFPYDFKEDGWNYEKYDNELKDPRYYSSRGLPEQIRAIQEMMERGINNMLIRDEMNNTPLWEVLETSSIMDGHLLFAPNQKIPVQAIGTEIKRLNEPNTVDLSSDRIMQILKATAEEYVGSTDQLFRNATNAGGGKTLGEIKEGVRQSSGPLNVEIINWNETLSKVYQKVFDILKDRLEDDLFVDGMRITREDFNFPAEVRSNGTLEVSDKQLATQKAIMRLQAIPTFIQGGIANTEDYFNAASDWLEKDGVKDSSLFLTDPKEIAQTQIAQLQQAIQQLSQQAQQLQEANQQGQKDLAKVKKSGKKAVKQIEGQVEAVANTGG